MGNKLNFNKIKNIITKKRIISFDIFDTLLLRPFVKPTDLFFYMEKIYNIEGFAAERINAEIRTKEKFNNQEDITYDEIYNEIDNKYKHLKENELELEKQFLFPNDEIKKLYDFAIKQGIKVIITSDMYLPKKFLEEVLEKNGYTGYNKFYLSSEIMKTKASSSLYFNIIKDLKVKPNQILHIGDNYHSDFVMAKKCGVDAFYIEKNIDNLFKNNKRAKIFYEKNFGNIGCSILLGILSSYKNNNYWENFGFQYGGSTIYAYTKWLNNKFIQDEIENAIFVARDGYTLQKVFEIIKSSDTKSYYVYAPRILNLICNLQYENRINYNDAEGFSAVMTIIDYFKNKDSYLYSNTPEIKTVSEGVSFIEKNETFYRKMAENEKKLYLEYLSQFNLSDKKMAVVDTVSGFLSSQIFFETIMNRKIDGYYWLTWERTLSEKSKHNFFTFQSDHIQKFLDWDLMEFIMTAPEPPIQNVINGKPLYKEISQNDKIRIAIYPTISNEAIKFAQLTQAIFKEKDTFLDCDLMIDWVNTLISNPTHEDIKYFRNIMHAWDSNHECYVPVIKSWYKERVNLLQTIFSVKNSGERKIIRIFGIKISVKRKIK